MPPYVAEMPVAGFKIAELFLLTTLRLWLAAHRLGRDQSLRLWRLFSGDTGMTTDALSAMSEARRRSSGLGQFAERALELLHRFRISEFWRDETDTPARVAQFRDKAIRLLLIEQWALLVPIAVTAYLTGNSWTGILIIGAIFHGCTSWFRRLDPIGPARLRRRPSRPSG